LETKTQGGISPLNHPYLTGGGLSVGLASFMVPGSEAFETMGIARAAYLAGDTSLAASRMLPSLLYAGAATANLLTLPSYYNGLREANSAGSYSSLAFETGLRMLPAAGNAYGALTTSLLVSNLSTGAASFGTLIEDLNYAGLVLTSPSSHQQTSGATNGSTGTSSSQPASGGSSGSSAMVSQVSANNGGWGSSHSACGTICN
jgi:hypothetical protein